MAQDTVDQIESRFERDRPPLSQAGRVIPQFDPLDPPTAASAIRFRFGGISFSGNTVFSDQRLASEFAGLIGTQISVGQVFGIANRVTSLYGDAGFPLSRAIVPAQDIGKDGIVAVRIIEGFVDRAVIDGNRGSDPLLRRHAAALEAERPLAASTLERELLLADDIPGVAVRSILRPSADTFGATTVILDVDEEAPFKWSVEIDNRGSDAVGPWQTDINLAFNELIHTNSKTGLRFVNAGFGRELLFATATHNAVLNAAGTRLLASLKQSRSEPGTAIFESIELETEATTAALEVRHPWIRSRNRNLLVFAALEARDSETRSLGTVIAADSIRSLRFGVDFDTSGPGGGQTALSLGVSRGLTAFGASDNDDPLKSREFGKVDYLKATLSATRTQPVADAWSIHAAFMAQASGDPLLSSEECALGGKSFGRGFSSSALSGDRCAAASVELRHRLARTGPFDSLQVFGFYEAGRVSNVDPGSTGWQSLASAGLGARIRFQDRYSAAVEVSKPLRRSGGVEDDSAQVFVMFRGEF